MRCAYPLSEEAKLKRSDNGTNFIEADRHLREATDHWNQSAIHNALLQKNVQWIFNSPAGSYHGGVCERQIRTVRKIASHLLRKHILNEDRLQTFLLVFDHKGFVRRVKIKTLTSKLDRPVADVRIRD